MTVDTSRKFTVVSQFRDDKLTMFFVQDGKKIEMPPPKWDGIPQDSGDLTPEFCSAAPAVFGDRDRFEEVGGFPQLNAALRIPMVLAMSIWDDVSFYNSKNTSAAKKKANTVTALRKYALARLDLSP